MEYLIRASAGTCPLLYQDSSVGIVEASSPEDAIAKFPNYRNFPLSRLSAVTEADLGSEVYEIERDWILSKGE